MPTDRFLPPEIGHRDEPKRDHWQAGHKASCPLSYPEIRSVLLPPPCTCGPRCRWCKSAGTQGFMAWKPTELFWSCDDEKCLEKSETFEREKVAESKRLLG